MHLPDGPSPPTPPEFTSELTLFGYWGCPFVHRVWIALNLKEIPFQWCPIYSREKQAPWYKSIFPLGRIPAVGFQDGEKTVTLIESLLIMEFLDERYPDSIQLLPKDPIARARARTIVAHYDSLFNGPVRQLMSSTSPAKSQDIAKGLEASLQWLESVVDEIDALSGESLGFVEVALVPEFLRFRNLNYWRGYDMDSKLPPKVQRLYDRITSHPAVLSTFYKPGGVEYLDAVALPAEFMAKQRENHFKGFKGMEEVEFLFQEFEV